MFVFLGVELTLKKQFQMALSSSSLSEVINHPEQLPVGASGKVWDYSGFPGTDGNNVILCLIVANKT